MYQHHNKIVRPREHAHCLVTFWAQNNHIYVYIVGGCDGTADKEASTPVANCMGFAQYRTLCARLLLIFIE